MMKHKTVKRIACLAAVLLLLVSGMTAFADDNIRTVTGLSGYIGRLYLSDWDGGGIVLTNVKPVIETPETLAVAAQLEYNEIPVFEGNIYSKDGSELDLNSLAWYLDMNVKVVAAHLDDGSYRLVYVVTQ